MSWVNRTIIVAASDAPLARSLSAGIAGESGTGMFSRELAPTSAGPASHFISSGFVWPQYAALMQDANAMYAAAQSAGASVTLAQCQALVANSTVQDASLESPTATLARLGLTFVQKAL